MDHEDLEVCLRTLNVLNLQYFVCKQCGTVYASPDEPPKCDDCSGLSLREITHELYSDTYFTQ